ncbi:MAG: glycoside hydrolase family 2 TIM barrel-domain containing protein, partial [Longimicrobiales bacterium]
PGADVRIRVAGPPQSKEPGAKLRIRLTAPDGQLIEREEQLRLQRTAAGVEQELTVPIDISNPILWELDAPQLYSAEVSVESGGVVVDSASTEFGMRRIEARGDRVYLNNRPLYLVGGGLDPGPYGGAVDINWHLPPPYALPSDETIQRDIRTTKSLGVNFVRVPLRSADPRFLYWADRMGLLVMQGGPWTPTEGIVGKEGFDRYKEWWTEAILRDRNHPSLVLWELFNESFGISWEQFKAISAALFEHVKALDPTRFVLDNAGGRYLNEINYIGNHGKTDLHDVHSYPSFAVGVEGANFEQRYPKNTRDLWLGLRSSGKPVLITEFAPAPYVYNVDKIKQKWAGKEPWWFQSRAKRTAMPAQWDHVGFEERFQRWRFDELYGDFTGFTEASDWYYFEGLKFQTELMRMNPETAGFVSWLFDSAPHPVGSIDFYKDKKVYCEELAKVWTQDLVILDNLRHNTWAGETIRADVHVSHFSHAKLKDGRIQWWLEGSELRGEIGGISLQPGEVKRVGEIVFRAPQVPAGKAMRLLARLLLGSETLSENGISVRVFPIEDRRPSVQRVNFVGMDHSRFQVLGYDVAAPGQKPSHPGMNFDPSVPVAVTLSLDNPALRQYLKEGGSVILMVCSEANYWERRPVARMPAVERFLEPNGLALGGRFQGGHSDSFFVRRNVANLFKRIPFRNPITWPFYRVWPNNTLLGMKAEEQSDVIAGAYGNLIRSIPMDTVGKQRWSEVNATVAQFRCGKGRLIVSTFELASPCLDDPIAAIMLNDLIQYAASDFAPKREFLLS